MLRGLRLLVGAHTLARGGVAGLRLNPPLRGYGFVGMVCGFVESSFPPERCSTFEISRRAWGLCRRPNGCACTSVHRPTCNLAIRLPGDCGSRLKTDGDADVDVRPSRRAGLGAPLHGCDGLVAQAGTRLRCVRLHPVPGGRVAHALTEGGEHGRRGLPPPRECGVPSAYAPPAQASASAPARLRATCAACATACATAHAATACAAACAAAIISPLVDVLLCADLGPLVLDHLDVRDLSTCDATCTALAASTDARWRDLIGKRWPKSIVWAQQVVEGMGHRNFLLWRGQNREQHPRGLRLCTPG